MLVLKRRRNQSIMIGDDIEIMVTEIRDGDVKLGINAPKEIPVHRREIFDLIAAENRRASQVDKPECM